MSSEKLATDLSCRALGYRGTAIYALWSTCNYYYYYFFVQQKFFFVFVVNIHNHVGMKSYPVKNKLLQTKHRDSVLCIPVLVLFLSCNVTRHRIVWHSLCDKMSLWLNQMELAMSRYSGIRIAEPLENKLLFLMELDDKSQAKLATVFVDPLWFLKALIGKGIGGSVWAYLMILLRSCLLCGADKGGLKLLPPVPFNPAPFRRGSRLFVLFLLWCYAVLLNFSPFSPGSCHFGIPHPPFSPPTSCTRPPPILLGSCPPVPLHSYADVIWDVHTVFPGKYWWAIRTVGRRLLGDHNHPGSSQNHLPVPGYHTWSQDQNLKWRGIGWLDWSPVKSAGEGYRRQEKRGQEYCNIMKHLCNQDRTKRWKLLRNRQ